MLLRSASSPIMKSSGNQSFTTSTRTRPNTTRHLSASSSAELIPRTSSDGNLVKMSIPIPEKKMGVYSESASSLFTEGRGVDGGGVGGYYGGGGSRGGGSGDGCESVDGYYQEMIRRYPDDALLLANYARFLKEVKGYEIKAEEYCESAILAKGNDGNLLSMYGGLIWNNHKDNVRAESYFDQALQSSPHDCYVLASYVRFLWDAEEEDEDDAEEQSPWLSYLSTSNLTVNSVS